MLYLAVGCGAAIGALARYLCAPLMLSLIGLGPLWATGFVNVAGSFVIGLFAALSGPGGRLQVSPAARLFVTTGFCGGFTTFSAMSLDTFLLATGSGPAVAGVYLCLSVALSLAAVWSGYGLATQINRRGGNST
ncbi:CrcB family protein [Reyranella sp. CPCC 100927]|uniref:CrcB family protein n=1 Tax=Reyranella sp. CPCC 100927 TaxID=2599616 RepID=UPI0011B533C2|nr:CrcB family protein [Reyranella sp. CPCC 100927]TWT13056.1 camphor resistance protein CrcB [Reyranella sp. CPCC 100927]